MCVHIGICIVEITTIITSMDVIVGTGVGSVALVCTSTVCAPCTATIRVTGAVCAHIGTCGGAIIITSALAGSGDDGAELVVICTACAS
jgi:hypothetical protein